MLLLLPSARGTRLLHEAAAHDTLCLSIGLAVRRMAGVVSHDLEGARRLYEAGFMPSTITFCARACLMGLLALHPVLRAATSTMGQAISWCQSGGIISAVSHWGSKYPGAAVLMLFARPLPGVLLLKSAGRKSLQTGCRRVVSLQAGCRYLLFPAGWSQHNEILEG